MKYHDCSTRRARLVNMLPDLDKSVESGRPIPVCFDFLAIILLYIPALMISNPAGNFPLNDDWAYALTVNDLLKSGTYHPLSWAAMSLLTNVVWGALFCLPLGFSFNVLRASTLVLSLTGIFATYLLNRELRVPRMMSVITALMVGFNPIYWALSNTFMTDVPYMALQILSVLFLVRSLNTVSKAALLTGTLFALAATLSRQTAIAIPVAFAFASMLHHGINRKTFMQAVFPFMLCLGALFFYQQWLVTTNQLPLTYQQRSEDIREVLTTPGLFFSIVSVNTYVLLLYAGLFLLPVLVIAMERMWCENRKRTTVVFLVSILLMTGGAWLFFDGNVVQPMLDNIIIKSGIGPLTLRDTYILGLDDQPGLPHAFWLAVTVLSFLGAGIMLTIIVGAANSALNSHVTKVNPRPVAAIFVILVAIIYFVPLLIGNLFDRYVVPGLPFIAAGISSMMLRPGYTPARSCQWVVVMLVAFFSFYAVCGTRDYLTWNRVRWTALHDLIATRQGSEKNIDGGFEFNGLYAFDPYYRITTGKSWWWVHDDKYVISFRPIPGYRIFREYHYSHWLPIYEGSIMVLEKNKEN